jgi:hypothetical protein
VANTTVEISVRIFAAEFRGIRTGIRMRRAVGIAFQGNVGHGDDGSFGKPVFQVIVFRIAFSQSEPPPVMRGFGSNFKKRQDGISKLALMLGSVLFRASIRNGCRESGSLPTGLEIATVAWLRTGFSADARE